MLSRITLSKMSLAAFASLLLATSAAWTVTNPKAEDEVAPLSTPWVRFNPSQEVEVSLNSTASETLSAKTTEPLEADAKQTSLSLMEQLPTEILHQIFSYLSLRDLSPVALASSRLQKASRTAPLWKTMSFKLKLVDESFSVLDLDYKAIVSAAFDRTFIDSIFNRICISIPESIHCSTEKKDSLMKIHSLVRLCRLGDKKTLLNAVGDVITLSRDLNRDADKELIERTARELNDALVAQGDENAITRKIRGLVFGVNGYKKDPAAARELNEALIAQKDKDAIKRKIDEGDYGGYGYEKSPAAARELNEALIAQGDKGAFEKKIEGLKNGTYGYEKSPAAERELNEALIAQEDKDAIKRKIDGLTNGWGGYEKDPAAARELNNALIARTDSEAIRRKLMWLSRDSKMSWENYIDCLKMALGVTDSLEILSESPEKAYIDCLGVFSQRIKQLRSEP